MNETKDVLVEEITTSVTLSDVDHTDSDVRLFARPRNR